MHEEGVGTVGTDGHWGYAAAAGRAGVEFDFWFPLQLSIDWRPTIGAGLAQDPIDDILPGLYWDVFSLCLGVRYKF